MLFIFQPGTAHDGAEAGAYLFVNALLPYLLPYIILTQWLLKTPSTGSRPKTWKSYLKAYVLGSFGGFPVGAVTVTEMFRNRELSRKESSLLLAACHAPGPMFIIGFVGTELFGDVQSGWKLLAAIHIANLLFFLLTLFLLRTEEGQDEQEFPSKPKSSGPLLEAIKDSSSVIILVATTVIFFSSLGNVITSTTASAFTVDIGIAKTIVLSFFEMTSGVQSATDHFYNLPLFPFIVAAIISMNGLSIHMQVYVIAKGANLSLKPYFFSRLWSILAVPLILYLIYV
ncbi:hypothetical protein [Sporosarcina sp. Te-1]|uniref:hypothetical protein n=1 Tax=Sporosarcina sp. Te-1 TaxID=2818390 RepID=UPI001A9EEEE6|nr:hypothetical protein [Sporosarcina sp. Te-1]QTD42419.1 hypothetical protein J3U78_06300 [Sporosarcina sp. Te-1]